MLRKIYYTEDDDTIAELVKESLEANGFQVHIMRTIEETKNQLNQELPSMLLVDWNLPDGSGQSLCNWVRRQWTDLPVILITVRGDTKDVVEGFTTGADDYVVKPFELQVLLSRINALLRRSNKTQEILKCGDIVMDKKRMIVSVGGQETSLSQSEYELLRILLENKNHTTTRNRLLELIWDVNGNYVNDNSLTVTMKRLREKLKNPSCIKTIRSFGYRMEDKIEE